MAFSSKTWQDRRSEYPTRRTLTPTGTENVYTVSRNEGTVYTEGDAFSAENMNDLESRIASAIASVESVSGVTGVKGSNETSYRTGNVNITKANIGLGNVENKSSATIRGELTKANVTAALGTGSSTTTYLRNDGTWATPPDTNTTYGVATQYGDGLMSKSDKTKLDGIATGATKTAVKGNAESSYRTGNVNITAANIGLGRVSNVTIRQGTSAPANSVGENGDIYIVY